MRNFMISIAWSLVTNEHRMIGCVCLKTTNMHEELRAVLWAKQCGTSKLMSKNLGHVCDEREVGKQFNTITWHCFPTSTRMTQFFPLCAVVLGMLQKLCYLRYLVQSTVVLKPWYHVVIQLIVHGPQGFDKQQIKLHCLSRTLMAVYTQWPNVWAHGRTRAPRMLPETGGVLWKMGLYLGKWFWAPQTWRHDSNA